MAVTFESSEPIARSSSYYIATQDIDIDAANNGRHVLPNIDWLVESIRRDGQKVPCVVGKNGTRAKMIEGHSRWRAICEINKGRKPEERLKVWCVYFQGNEVDALITGFTANRERNALTPVDEGYFVARMERFGKSLEDIAAICHEDVAWCKQRLALVSLTPEAQQAVSGGSVKITAAVALAKLAADEQRRYLKSEGKMTAAAIKKFTAPNGATHKPSRPSIKQVGDILRDIAGHDKYPSGLSAKCSKDDLCQWLLEYMETGA